MLTEERVTEVCHFGHFWLSYGRSAMSGSPMGRSEVTEVCHFGHFWLSHGRSTTSGSPKGQSKGDHNNEKVIWCIGSSIACIACFYMPYDCLAALGSPIGELVGLL